MTDYAPKGPPPIRGRKMESPETIHIGLWVLRIDEDKTTETRNTWSITDRGLCVEVFEDEAGWVIETKKDGRPICASCNPDLENIKGAVIEWMLAEGFSMPMPITMQESERHGPVRKGGPYDHIHDEMRRDTH
jgi:hypothetical protein